MWLAPSPFWLLLAEWSLFFFPLLLPLHFLLLSGVDSLPALLFTSVFFFPQQCEVATSDRQKDQEVNFKELRTTAKMTPELLSGHIPPGHIPKPIVMPDYVA